MAAVFREATATPRTVEVGLSHVSVELGHLYADDLLDEDADLSGHFAAIAPWVTPDQLGSLARLRGQRLRASTCFLIDDYSSPIRPPSVVIPRIVAAAAEQAVPIDYIARESGCATGSPFSPAELVASQIVPDPAPGTNASRPPLSQAGWLSNGQRAPASTLTRAMGAATPWMPPRENGARKHSVFVDVELWNESEAGRAYSCSFLASVWQLVRLGLLRAEGKPPIEPEPVDLAALPETWNDLPPVIQVAPRAKPFCAYRTFSVLDGRFLSVEHAVRTVLSQVQVEPTALSQTRLRGSAEGVEVPEQVPARTSYLFLGP